MKVIHINGSEPATSPKPIGVIRIRESDYLKTLEVLRNHVRMCEEDGDKAGADFVRGMIDSYKSTGNSMLPIGAAKLEIIEG